MKKVAVIDGQGGGIGKSIVELIKKQAKDVYVIAVGTNSLATSAMLKAGADIGATGENAVTFNCSDVDIIVAPIGIAFANSMLGEVSEKMAIAVGGSKANKIFIPMNKCNTFVVGVVQKPFFAYIEEAVEVLKSYL